MHDEEKNLGTLLISLPAELRIDIYERVFNASLDDRLLPERFKSLYIQRRMLRTLHINRAIRNDSKMICAKLAKRHLEALEISIPADTITRDGLYALCVLQWRDQAFEDRMVRFSDLNHEKIPGDTEKAKVLAGLLRILKTPGRGRFYVSWLNVRRRLQVFSRGTKQKLLHR